MVISDWNHWRVFIFRHRIDLVPLEAPLEPAEKSSSSSLREQGPKPRAPNRSYSPPTAELEKERAGQTSRVKYMYKVGWEALTPTPTVSMCETRLFVSGATSHHSPLLPTCADLNFTPSCLVFSTYFNSQTPHSKKKMFFSCTEDNSISAITWENLGSACCRAKHIMSCNVTFS